MRRNATRMSEVLRKRRAADDERGAVLVEFALVVILLLVLVFGIVEFSLAWNVKSEAEAAVRAGGRSGSAMSKEDTLARTAADAAASVLRTVPGGEPQYVLVYKVGPSDSGNPPSSCTGSTTCVRYNWVGGALDVAHPQGTWPASNQNSCTAPYDQVGVYVNIKHPLVALPGLIPGMPDNVTLDPHSVFALEPSPDSVCS